LGGVGVLGRWGVGVLGQSAPDWARGTRTRTRDSRSQGREGRGGEGREGEGGKAKSTPDFMKSP
jgi:hypothetical protein